MHRLLTLAPRAGECLSSEPPHSRKKFVTIVHID